MAFEVPLEADNVDGTNFLVALVSAPVMGVLSWVLGRGDDDTEKKDNNDNKLQADGKDDATAATTHSLDESTRSLSTKCSSFAGSDQNAIFDSMHNDVTRSYDGSNGYPSLRLHHDPNAKHHHHPQQSLQQLKKGAPNWMMGSDVSDIGEEHQLFHVDHHQPAPLLEAVLLAENHPNRRRRQRPRRLSWSDERGLQLAQRMDEVSRYCMIVLYILYDTHVLLGSV